MEIYLVRHGIAEEVSSHGGDAARKLTKEGREKTERAARGFRKQVGKIDFIYHSSYVRAEETAEIFSREFPEASVSVAEGLTPLDNADRALSLLRKSESHGKVMLVGHEPHLSSLASLLLTGSRQPILEFKKSGIAGIECDKDLTSCRLRFLLSPKWL